MRLYRTSCDYLFSLAQGMPECSDCTCMLVCAFLCTHCTRDRGCSGHPAFPAPSVFGEGTSSCKPRAQCVARMRSDIWSSSSALRAIARWGGRSSIPETAVMEAIGRGVLDTRLRGYDVPSSLRAQRSNPSFHARGDNGLLRFARNDGDGPQRTEYPLMCGI